MKTNFKFQGVHDCEAAVLSCIDFRFWKDITNFIENDLGIKSYDFPSLPGAAKAINDCMSDEDMGMQCVSIPCRLHNIKKLVIVNHADCGAYGGVKKFNGDTEEEEKFHAEELRKAKAKVKEKYPELEVITALAKIVDNGENIEFLTIA